MRRPTIRRGVCLSVLLLAIPLTWADERRAPAPKYTDKDVNGVFFEDLSKAFRGAKPTLSTVRDKSAAAATKSVAPAGGDEKGRRR